MPKILINEKDRTSPGTAGSYTNYTVLVTGFMGRDPVRPEDTVNTDGSQKKDSSGNAVVADKIQPDSNGVYEFTSAADFKDTIGLVGPTTEKIAELDAEVGGGSVYWKHYGNQMAYELLNLGYPVIYKPIEVNAALKVFEEDFWEVFKDKANYDFRFITHGFLESNEIVVDTTIEQAKVDAAKTRLAEVKNAIEELSGIKADFITEKATNQDLEESVFCNGRYDTLVNNEEFPGLKATEAYTSGENTVEAGSFYTTFEMAEAGTTAEKAKLDGLIESNEAAISKKDADANSHTITKDRFSAVNTVIANLANYKATGSKDINGDETNDMNSREAFGRGDCIALIELDESAYVQTTASEKPEHLIINEINNEMGGITETNGKYCAMTVPSVVYKMTDIAEYNNNKKFPGAFHYLACFAKSLNSGFAEWYAAAGYTRGVSDYVIDHTTVKLGEVAINVLEPRNIVSQSTDPKFACNVIANFRGNYYLWGNRTAHPLGDAMSAEKGDLTASHFLNIRQLCTTIKKQLYVACRRFTFDPNSDTLWFNFVNAIKPTLEVMKADQGIRDYKILKVLTDRKATLKAKIRIIPIEAVEDFDLEVSLEDSFGETTAVVTE